MSENRSQPSRAVVSALRGAMLVLALGLAACGPSPKAPQIDDSDYIFPDLARGEVNAREEKALRAAWTDVVTGQPARAESAMAKLLVGSPSLRAAWIVRGFAAIRAKRLSDAETTFAALVKAGPDDAVSLVGLAAVKRLQGHLDEALPLYVKASRLRPRDNALSRRAAEVKLSVAEGAIAQASSLSAEGRKPEAIAMLQKALEVAPELGPVRLELADLLIEAGRRPEALSVLSGGEEGDRAIALRIATLKLEEGDLDGAEALLRRAFKDVGDDPDAAALATKIREKREVLALPEPLRAIGDATRITRADLAGLVVSKVDALRSRKALPNVEVATDLSRTWARPQILRAIELGLMDVYPNHAFQPNGVVRRGELAVVAARVLDLVGVGRGSAAAPRDMSPSHLQYAAALRVMGAGIMQATPAGAFEPWRIVTGAEAKSVVEALARLSAGR